MVNYENLDEAEGNFDDEDLGWEFVWMWQSRSEASDDDDDDDHGGGGSSSSSSGGEHNIQMFR
jgi:hypothetical protein